MSTVGTITPYEEVKVERSSATGIITTLVVAGVVGAIGKVLVDSLRQDEQQKNVVEQFKEEGRRDRLQVENRIPLVSAKVTLKLRSMESFVRSAESLGFGLLPFNKPNIHMETQPLVTLISKTGERLFVQKNEIGKLVVLTTGDLSTVQNSISAIQNVVTKNNFDKVRKYLGNRCKDVRVQQRTDGVSEFAGVENKTGSGRQAKINVQIKKDGGVKVDVSDIKGKRCDAIIQDIARVVEGECIKFEHKGEYYQVVEEKERIRG